MAELTVLPFAWINKAFIFQSFSRAIRRLYTLAIEGNIQGAKTKFDTWVSEEGKDKWGVKTPTDLLDPSKPIPKFLKNDFVVRHIVPGDGASSSLNFEDIILRAAVRTGQSSWDIPASILQANEQWSPILVDDFKVDEDKAMIFFGFTDRTPHPVLTNIRWKSDNYILQVWQTEHVYIESDSVPGGISTTFLPFGPKKNISIEVSVKDNSQNLNLQLLGVVIEPTGRTITSKTRPI